MATLLLMVSLHMGAVPARPGRIMLSQPDGSRFEAFIKGDEYGHLVCTADGCALICDSGGWYHYASFGPDGERRSSGVRVGDKAPQDVLLSSRSISYESIRRQARLRRRSMGRVPSLMKSSVQDRPGYKAYVSLPPEEFKVIVLLAEFDDEKFTFTRDNFVDMFNKEGYSFGGATGSVKEYFNAQFRGRTAFTFDVGPVVTLSKPVAEYGANDSDGNDKDAAGAVAEACRLSDADVDFSKYSGVYVVYAGGSPADGSASDDHIWPHSWDLRSAGYNVKLDGRTISTYSMSSELSVSRDVITLCSIGTFCHEFSHMLGLMDEYDTDFEDSGGLDRGHYITSVMDVGVYNNDGNTPPMYNATELDLLGLVQTETIAAGHYDLAPITTEPRILRIDSGDECEYYLIEARSATLWDRFIGGSGLLVYHVDMSGRPAGYSTTYDMEFTALQRWMYNEINARPDYLCSDLVEAWPDAVDASGLFFPYSTSNSFGGDTEPAMCFRDGSEAVFALTGIQRGSGGTVSFRVTGPVTVDSQDILQEAAIFNWSVDPGSGCTGCHIRLMHGEEELDSADISAFKTFHYAYTAKDLVSRESYLLEITCELQDGSRVTRLPFETRAFAGKTFIYIAEDGRIPLRVYNAAGVDHVVWTLGGRSVKCGSDGFIPSGSRGELKAHVYYSSGDEEILIKKLVQ